MTGRILRHATSKGTYHRRDGGVNVTSSLGSLRHALGGLRTAARDLQSPATAVEATRRSSHRRQCNTGKRVTAGAGYPAALLGGVCPWARPFRSAFDPLNWTPVT